MRARRRPGGAGVTVQLAAQEAKAWTRIGDRRQVELASPLPNGHRCATRRPEPPTLGVVAAGQGDLERAVELGTGLIDGGRLSKPHFHMLAGELGTEGRQRFAGEPAARSYLELVRSTL